MDFKSQICTTREQSERLLALGLKKETADMVHSTIVILDNLVDLISVHPWTARQEVTDYWYPAWSLHRLIELAYGNWKEDIAPIYLGNSYDMLIERIKFQVKQGKFNKEYLV